MRGDEDTLKKAKEPELHQAAEAGESARFSELLEEPGVDIFSKNSEGLTVLAIAEEKIRQNWFRKKAPFERVLKSIERHLFIKLSEAMKRSDKEFERYLNLTKETFPSILKAVLIGPGNGQASEEWDRFGLLPLAMPLGCEPSERAKRNYETLPPVLPSGRGVRCAELILEMGKPLGCYSPIDVTFLNLVAAYASSEMLDLLISKKSAPLGLYIQNPNPLNSAIQSNQIESVKLILDWIPSLDVWVKECFPPPQEVAVHCGNREIVKLIYQKAELPYTNLLYYAAKYGNKDLFDFAVNTGVSNFDSVLKNALDHFYYNPSCIQGVFFLISEGAGSCIPRKMLSCAEKGIKQAQEALWLLLRGGAYLIEAMAIFPPRVCIREEYDALLSALKLTKTERTEFSMLFKLAPYRMKIFELIGQNNFKGLKFFLEEAKKEFSAADFMKILNSRDEQILTPLQEARKYGFTECEKILVAENAPEQFSILLEIPPKNEPSPVSSASPRKNSMDLIRKNKQSADPSPMSSERPQEPVVNVRLKNLLDEIRAKNIDTSSIDEEFICPITHEIMTDPILATDENSYEREFFCQYIEKQKQENLPLLSPVTEAILESENFIANAPLRKLIIKRCETLLANHQRVIPPSPSLILEAVAATPAVESASSCSAPSGSISDAVLANTSPVFTRAASPKAVAKQDRRETVSEKKSPVTAPEVAVEQEAPVEKKSSAVTKKTPMLSH